MLVRKHPLPVSWGSWLTFLSLPSFKKMLRKLGASYLSTG